MTTTQSELQRIVAKRNARLSKQTTPSRRKTKKAPASQPLHLRSVAPQCVVDAITRSIAIGRRT